MPTAETEIEQLANREYKWGFVTDIDADTAPPGLNEEIIRFISHKKNEPQWLLDWRLKSYRHWLTMSSAHDRNGGADDQTATCGRTRDPGNCRGMPSFAVP